MRSTNVTQSTVLVFWVQEKCIPAMHPWEMKMTVNKFALACTLLIASTAQAAPIQWQSSTGGNDHWYDIVSSEAGINFSDAATQAVGIGGYLATPNAVGEAAFIYDQLVAPTANGAVNGYWLGAQTLGPGQPWEWITGGTVSSWMGATVYIDWAEGSGAYGMEQIANNWWAGSGAALQDYPQTWKVEGFVVEYSSDPTNIPEPTSLILLGVGIAGLATVKRRVSRQ